MIFLQFFDGLSLTNDVGKQLEIDSLCVNAD